MKKKNEEKHTETVAVSFTPTVSKLGGGALSQGGRWGDQGSDEEILGAMGRSRGDG